jgi:hypothetical protein
VELFADPGDQGATFLATTTCSGRAFSVAGAFPAGLNATATENVGSATSPFSPPVAIQ